MAASGLPLNEVCVAITRPEHQARDLVDPLARAGARLVCVPLIRILPTADPGPLRNAVASLYRYDWLVFTSANAVTAFFEVAAGESVAGLSVAAVGRATERALEDHGVSVDLVPDTKDGASVAAALMARGRLEGRRILWPRAAAARKELGALLRAEGALVDAPEAYRTAPDPDAATALAASVAAGEVDVLTFTSPSAVRSYSGVGGRTPPPVRVAVIGPVTAAATREAGLPVHIVADDASAGSLAAAIIAACGHSS